MIENSYLYRDEEVPHIDSSIVDKRLQILNNTLSRLLAIDYTRRDTPRILAVTKAITFWSSINDQ